ncbi:MAG: transcriptional regulator [Sutterellaceae bacterium]|nr:transcriptional regulator [Burkholderiaceae bacterium]MDW8429046.1 transcriptional regulator [Sutterellaceae bacterium]
MRAHQKTLLVVIAEATLEKALIRDARAVGAPGNTNTEVRGGGERGEREAAWEADRSIEMKVICEGAVAQRLAEHVLACYAPNYAVTLFTAAVGVFRPEKF